MPLPSLALREWGRRTMGLVGSQSHLLSSLHPWPFLVLLLGCHISHEFSAIEMTYLKTPTSFFQKLNSFTSTFRLTASSTPGCPLTSLSSSTICIPIAPPRTSASTFFLTSFSVPPPILCLPALTLASTVVCTITSRRIRRWSNSAREFARWTGCGRGCGSFGVSARDFEGYSGAWKGV